MLMGLNPNVWGPHYWFFLHTIAITYPHHPNDAIKKKYYEFIQNLHLFLPSTDISADFSKLLDLYPVAPYLDSRESFIRWMHFIHNKINVSLEKPEMSLPEALAKYRSNYTPKPIYLAEQINMRRHYLYAFFIVLVVFLIYMYYE
jgi:hypothetical protein